jgi:transposase InsO family protein
MKKDHCIAQLCVALEVSRSGYHAWVKAQPGSRAQTDARLRQRIQSIHAAHRGRYGAPRIHQALRQEGCFHSRKRIARLMKADQLQGSAPKRFVPRTTDSTHDHPIAPNHLAQRPAPKRANEIWVSDLTYVATAEGWLYVAVILDLWSRRVVGWATGPSLQATLVLAALHMALRQRRPAHGLLHHSDRGVQYASTEHRARLRAAGLQASMSRAGNPYDNAAMESFMATYKRECVELAGGYASRDHATADFFAYVETYYNRRRLHSALGYKTPVDFENQVN